MILLSKIRRAEQVKDTRPIAIGCAAEKVYCRRILERTKNRISLNQPWQCAGARRQTCDFLYTLHKLFEEEREWSKGLCILKIDFWRAFDSVDRNRLLAKLWTLQGDCEEYRTWERLMKGTTFSLRTPWGQSSFASKSGIRQGSVESPAFFGVLMEWVLEDIMTTHEWRTHISSETQRTPLHHLQRDQAPCPTLHRGHERAVSGWSQNARVTSKNLAKGPRQVLVHTSPPACRHTNWQQNTNA